MPSKREKHSVNGKLLGVWYESADGKKMYLAHRTQKQVYRERNAWCMDLSILERAKLRGVTAIGVVRKEGGQRLVWLTHINDFYDSPHSFSIFHGSRQLGLPMKRFRIDPLRSEVVINVAVKIR
ncbi:hypothetical protein QN372_00065 [Undibacterium sp. RTI2.1]|uniref:hypothetical protein n=1 Tax=unclassified Undibacterium TaxID=2630295 RepID=UPI002AB5A9B2|nr:MULTISPECIES: hypothetical protein [unclassified Undibacterium]MDY7537534.1 hypothetical protein [Undibacterium sp. 5I1]MEB0029132.1 hypothetical protein [Undibacterium sp. RTI2.1]MEB0115440.1 hypothetical protein [Undibacterium sp. RTI2.2]MEB0231918.1 hypothetical protein [Undibacterium sp. 10I3]MEB0256269.1 hypothetical protein [Undibacterium sp. 5I1]